MAARATRTVNQLHFEDLEPHRFEDMVRQLVYDFRAWDKLEATGRLGGDDGCDIRGIEAGALPAADGDTDEPAEPPNRIWVIQCKREKELGPTAVGKIVRDAVPGGGDVPYGLILAAACDFSKKSMDTFHTEATKKGVTERHIWGKAALEDMLFQPKYDHLLFAYFNISLQVRRRSLRTSVRSRLATKRAAINILGDIRAVGHNKVVLLRDPREERYPEEDAVPDFATHEPWFYARFVRHAPPDHLMFVFYEHYAYADDTGEHWDAMLDFAVRPTNPASAWNRKKLGASADDAEPYWSYWVQHVPAPNRAMFQSLRVIHYDRVLAIDPDGDEVHPGPHIFVEFDPVRGPFETRRFSTVEFGLALRRHVSPTDENRVQFFPKAVPLTGLAPPALESP